MPSRMRHNHHRAAATGPGLKLLRTSSDGAVFLQLPNCSAKF
jgi:hypothetical protein